ncbi:MAG: ornithine carbamoyltransferase [Chloroflexi bacterium]|nr:ornithine carbamoyltransferase [Chloroflexota bacterium]
MKKDFLAVADFTPAELNDFIDLAIDLKKEYFQHGNQPLLKGKVLALIFSKPSLRTRISFEMGMRHLGGDALFISPSEIGLGKRESIADVARVLSGYVQGIMARVFEHEHVVELAKWADTPVINGLSDYNHPCQAMADILTIKEEFGSLPGLNVTYIGDGNNVAVSLMHVCAKLGVNFSIASPEDYDMPETAIAAAHAFAAESKSSLHFYRDPHEAVKEANVLYTDTWTSMGQEEEAQKREKVFPPYQVNQKLLKEAQPNAIVMHCLPAHRGQEITDEVADGAQSRLFPQAHNRLHAQKAIILRLMQDK